MMMLLEALENRLLLSSTLQVVISPNPAPAAGLASYTVHFVAGNSGDELCAFDGSFTGVMNQVWACDNTIPTPTMDYTRYLSPADLAQDTHLLLSSSKCITVRAADEDRPDDTGVGTYLAGGPGQTMVFGLAPSSAALDLAFAQIVIPAEGTVHLTGRAVTNSQVSVNLDVTIGGNAPAPTLALGAAPIALIEKAAAVALSPQAILVEPDNALAGATLKFSLGSAATVGDQFRIADQGTSSGQVGVSGGNLTYGGIAVGTFAGGSNGTDLTVTFNAAATADAIQAVLRDVTFDNTSSAPPTAARNISVVYADPQANTLSGTVSVTINAINDPPTVTVPGPLSVVSNTSVTFSTALGRAIGITDPDVGSGKMRFTLDATHGTLSLATTTGLTMVTGSGSNCSHIVFDGTLAAATAALNGLVFKPATGYVGDATISFLANDNGGSGGAKTGSGGITVTLTPRNTAPTAGSLTQTVDLTKATQFALPIGDAQTAKADLVLHIIQAPAKGTLQVLDNGQVRYTPSSSHVSGTDRFIYTVSDDGSGGAGGVMTSSQAAVTLNLGRKVTLDATGKRVYQDSNGNSITVTLSGGGTAALYFDTATQSDLLRIELTGTTPASILTFAPAVSQYNPIVGDIAISGPIGKIVATSCDLHGTVSIASSPISTAAASLTFHDVMNSAITSAMPLASLSVLDWRNLDGTDLIRAPRLDKLTSAGGFGAALTVSGALGTASIGGDLSGANWNVASGITSIAVAGTAGGDVIRCAHSIGSLSFGAVSHTDVLAGIRPAAAKETLRHAAASTDFLDKLASIGKLTIRGVGGGLFFADSNFSAAYMGTATILNADFASDGLWLRNATTPKPINSVNYSDATSQWTYTNGVDPHGLVHLI